MSLAPYIRAMGRGPSRGRSLTLDEAQDAMAQMLAGTAEASAVGALLMLMRYRGETADEVAGFTQAARAHLAGWSGIGAALDWPSYAAGRSRGLPWFLLSALLVARAGHPVLLHGWNSHQNPIADVKGGIDRLGIRICGTPDTAREALRSSGIAYVPLDGLCPPVLSLLKLRDVLGLRSAVNTVCRMLNPAGAGTMVQGVFHPSYRELQQDAAALLGQDNLAVLKAGGGEFERLPGKAVTLYGLAEAEPFTETAPRLIDAHRRLGDPGDDPEHLLDVWHGSVRDDWAEAIIIGTAGLALKALRPALGLTEAEALAHAQWQSRHQSTAA